MGAIANDCKFFPKLADATYICLLKVGGEHQHTDGTVVAGIFAFGAGPLKLDTTDTAGVVGILRQIPFPFRHRLVSGKGDLHYYRC